jgi:DNA-directed RNA polymerase subunit N (RpoN/RPB10)
MKQQQQVVLPVRCMGCGTVFDLWYDLVNKQGKELEDIKSDLMEANEHYCWRCRKIIAEDQQENEFSLDDIEVSEGELDEY